MNPTPTLSADLRSTHHAPRTTRSPLRIPHSAFRISGAFTLIETLVTISLLSFIVLGLFATFNQVQRAFRTSMNESDRLEAGRAVTGILPAELEQTTPCSSNAVTFSVQIAGSTTTSPLPLTQSLPGTAIVRTNLLEDCFMLLRQNQTWIGIGYCVRTNDSNGSLWLPESGPGQLGVGSLYRWSASTNVLRSDGVPSDPSQLYNAFYNACNNLPGPTASLAISNRLCDGVINFSFRAFATNGFPLYVAFQNGIPQAYFRTNSYDLYSAMVRGVQANQSNFYPDNWTALFFKSNSLPACVELEIGTLEQHAWERYNSIGAPAPRLTYLQRDDVASRVHLFRQRVPIRNVDPLAYQ